MKKIKIQCVGISALLMNPMTETTLDSLITGVRTPVMKDRPLDDVARERIYRNEKKQMGFPNINLIGALKHAGRAIKISGKKSISTATTTTLFSFLSFPDEFIVFDGLDEKGEVPWKTDKRRGVMKSGTTTVAVGIVRPRFDTWSFTVEVMLDETIVNEATLRKLFNEAGSNAGLCDFRPSKNGPFGRFTVKDWKCEDYKMPLAEAA